MINHSVGPIYGEPSKHSLDSWYMANCGKLIVVARTVYENPPSTEQIAAAKLVHAEKLAAYKPR